MDAGLDVKFDPQDDDKETTLIANNRKRREDDDDGRLGSITDLIRFNLE
jgi:hypothetical protein